ncbi:MAG: HEAT repeat domain-containing protein [Planctomycetes bacterium]|nr:HEAT repeat domain-containing protein [Planctomycetota bacterium]
MSKKTADSKAPLVAAVAVAGAFGLGFVAGRATAPEEAGHAHGGSRAAPVTGPTASAEPPTSHAGHAHAHARPKGERPAGPPVGPGEAPAPVDPAEVDAGLDRVLASARAVRAMPDDHHAAEAALLAAGELEQLLLRDPGALARALDAFRGLGEAGDLEALAAILGRLRDPAVEQVALEVARRDVSPARRLAALDVLDAMETPEARQVALDVLGSEQDVELRRAALRAIPEPAGASVEEAGGVVTTLSTILARDRDHELRRRAAVDLGSWARSEAELRPLLDALTRDPSPEVRGGAAFGLEMSRRRSPEVVEALAGVLGRRDEDPSVRENAWRALSALSPLPPAAQAAWRAYKAERDALGEVDDHAHGDDGHDHGH